MRAPVVEVRASLDNHFQDARDGARWARLDAETYRFDLAAAAALPGGRELRLELPFRVRSEGLLDGPIETWHRTLGLPEGTRPFYGRGRVRMLVGSDEAGLRERLVLLSEHGSAAGIGDVALTLRQALPVSRGGATAAAVAVSVELPTGAVDDLRGNGALDVGAGIALSSRLAEGLWSHWSADFVRIGRAPELESSGLRQAELTRRLAGALEWRARPGAHLIVMALAESSPVEVGVPLLDRDALMVAFGLRQVLAAGLELELALGEDLRVQTAPDLALQAGLRWTAR